ncbi:isochorismatase family protein [Neorhizobium sp. DAR64861/K0K2]|uniref:isochorismatase family protein n=1 Tax=unclassified Neorhizobium TaxID=2629175 RepID=UPI003D2881D4
MFAVMPQPIVVSSVTHPPDSIRRAAAALTQIARDLAIPGTASFVRLGEEAPVAIEELRSHSCLVRSTVSVLADAPCCDQIASNRRNTILFAGVSSEIAILHTALDARRAGYEVSVLIDCCGGLSSSTEATALDQMAAAGVCVSAWNIPRRNTISSTLMEGHSAGPVQKLMVNDEIAQGTPLRILPDYEAKPTEAVPDYASVQFTELGHAGIQRTFCAETPIG